MNTLRFSYSNTTLSTPGFWVDVSTYTLENRLVTVCDGDDYRFGLKVLTEESVFNGMEKDNEVKGKDNSLDLGSRIYVSANMHAAAGDATFQTLKIAFSPSMNWNNYNYDSTFANGTLRPLPAAFLGNIFELSVNSINNGTYYRTPLILENATGIMYGTFANYYFGQINISLRTTLWGNSSSFVNPYAPVLNTMKEAAGNEVSVGLYNLSNHKLQ